MDCHHSLVDVFLKYGDPSEAFHFMYCQNCQKKVEQVKPLLQDLTTQAKTIIEEKSKKH